MFPFKPMISNDNKSTCCLVGVLKKKSGSIKGGCTKKSFENEVRVTDRLK